MLPEAEAEDESIMQREYERLMKSREETRKLYEGREQAEKENRIAAGHSPGASMDVDQGASSAVSTDFPATVRGIRRTDTEEVFN
jgi:hypothetical protein